MDQINKELPTNISQEALPEVVINIEKYKETYNTYPETLNDLKQLWDEEYASTIDPFGIKWMIVDSITKQDEYKDINDIENLVRQYHYKNLGNKYTLFSAWPDNKPLTDDDIFPDSSKLPANYWYQTP